MTRSGNKIVTAVENKSPRDERLKINEISE